MLRTRILTILLASILASESLAIVMPDTQKRRLSFGLESMQVQQPAMDHQARLSGLLSFYQPVLDRLGYNLHLRIAPDQEIRSQAVEVMQHLYGFYADMTYNYVKWFRYSASAGPGFIWSQTNYDLLGRKASVASYDYAIFGRLGLDYAIDELWEAGVNLTSHYRTVSKKLDWSYGFSVNMPF